MQNSLLDDLLTDEKAFTVDSAENEGIPPYEPVPYEDVDATVSKDVDYSDLSKPDTEKGDELPPFMSFADVIECPPPRPFLIDNLLHKGDKMLITARSKAGKSMLLIELALAVANGGEWLGHLCNKGRVLYINLELNDIELKRRIFKVLDASGQEHPGDALQLWNLRGERIRPLDAFVDKITGRVEGQGFDLIILDPFYKMSDGVENAAEDVGEALLRIDAIIKASGASVAYTHHHSKGSQAGRSVLDRGSGSGVFVRDVDVLLDLIELDPGSAREYRLNGMLADIGGTDEALDLTQESKYWTAWRLQGISRNLPPMLPHNLWFNYPLHVADDDGLLDSATVMLPGGDDAKSESKYNTRRRENTERITDAVEKHIADTGQDPTAYDIAKALGIPRRTVQRHLETAGFVGYKSDGETANRYRYVVGGDDDE